MKVLVWYVPFLIMEMVIGLACADAFTGTERVVVFTILGFTAGIFTMVAIDHATEEK